MADPYQQRVAPGGSTPLPMADAEAFGAGVGRAVSGLGGSLENLALVERQVKRNEENAAAGKSLADLRLAATQSATDMRANAQPGAVGHADAAARWWDENSQPLLDGIGDEKVRRNVELQLREQRAAFVGGEYEWEAAKRVAKVRSDETDAATTGLNRIATAPDLATAEPIVAQERQASVDRIHGYAGISDDDKERMIHQLDQGIAQTTLDLGVRTDPAKARALLDAGAFNILKPEEIKQGYAAIGVEERRAEAQAAHAAALQKKAVMDQVEGVNAQIEAGVVVPDADLQKTAAAARAVGEETAGFKLDVARVRAGINRETEAWTPQQYDANIAQLRALGEKRTAAQDIQLKHLETIAPGRKEEFAKDPGAWGALNGDPAPALDMADPATWAQRRQWQGRISSLTRQPVPFLQPAEVQALKANYEQSPASRLAVINEIAPIGGRTAQLAMRQIAPQDDVAARIVLLPAGDRAAAAAGVDARKTHPELVDGKQKAITQKLFGDRMGPAGSLLDQGEVGAVLDIARNIYADSAVKNGIAAFNKDLWNTSIHRALGGTRDPQGNWLGGVGSWGDTPVLLPPTMTQKSFETHLSRMNWTPNWDHAPVFRDGTPMTPAQVKQYVPVARPDGRYEFHGPGGAVLADRAGGFWTVSISPQGVHR